MSLRQILLATLSLLTFGPPAVAADLIRPLQAITPARESTAPSPAPRPPAMAMPVAPGLRPLMAPLFISQAVMPPTICAALKPKSDAMTSTYGHYRTALNGTGENCALTGMSVPNKLDSVLYEHCCGGNVSFSVHDQQTAGCVGSDTVSACMEKLTRQCIRSRAQSTGLSAELQKHSEAYKEISARSAELAQQMRNVLMLMP